MAKKKKKPLTRLERLRKRDGRLMLAVLTLTIVPVILMLLGVWIPGRAFS